MSTNGARLALETAHAAGVDTCFANPGTTEMDWVIALEEIHGIRSVLCLFEGVATGAADAYGRMTGRPALTLLHLGPGFANGIANLHNARRAGSPVVNLIGDHASWHLSADAPLTSDIESLASPVSQWIARPDGPRELAEAMAQAVAVASGSPSGVASLIVPQDAAWAEADLDLPDPVKAARTVADPKRVEAAAQRLAQGGPGVGLLLGGVLQRESLEAAARIRQKTGCRVWLDTFLPRLREGRGLPAFDPLPYFPEQAMESLAGLESLVLAGTSAPVAFFGYRSLGTGDLLPDGCESLPLADAGTDSEPGLAALAAALEAAPWASAKEAALPPLSDGPLDAANMGLTVAHWLPDEAIVVNEAATSGLGWGIHGRGAAAHDTLSLTGGAIGQGIPNAVGAAIACPDRPVVLLQADGSGMYTLQGLWTLAREALNVTVIVCANRAYRILQAELQRSGLAQPGPVALGLTDLSGPNLDWVRLAEGMGVPGCRVERSEELARALEQRSGTPGPYLIEALL